MTCARRLCSFEGASKALRWGGQPALLWSRRKDRMARIAGVNIPTNKRVEIALTYIHGIGRTKARELTQKLGIASERRVQDLTRSEERRVGKERRSRWSPYH